MPTPPAPPAKADAKAPAPAAPPKAEAKTPAAAPRAAAESGWIPASPIARRMARDAGIDLSKISGSGPGGRILERDVEAHVAAQAQRLGGADVPTGAREFEDKDLSTIRKTIAARMVQSKAPIPHFTVTVEADMGAAQDLRTSLNAIDPNAEKLSVNHILIKAVALALKRNPAINASYHDGKVRLFNRVHIGVAVALEDGLIVPVIRECDRKSLGEIAREAKALIERARGQEASPGGVFRRDLRHFQPGHVRRGRIHRRDRPRPRSHPGGGGHRGKAGGDERPDRRPPADAPDRLLRPPDHRRRHGGQVPPGGEEDPGKSSAVAAVARCIIVPQTPSRLAREGVFALLRRTSG